ncbi:YceI family protein [Streptomyces chiangmaiensis]|uniref:YceI family protein n=1 Tax=Streptomyces chiangmaiensis TaxID=766497 RepID=A0ABU7FRI0_9ACTN|nr:YceI family protein [Streptomyces chiangmaiensis]MED7826083.1 YceI family protein [Streptomyces chiangmaiensis]
MFHHRDSAVFRTGPSDDLTGIYIVDPVRSTVGVSVRHAVITDLRGKFTAFEGLLRLDGSRRTRSEVHLSVQTGSFDAGTPERDAQVTGPDFLDSATFPVMTFRSVGLLDAGDDRIRAPGHLRIKILELPVHIDLEFGGTSRDAYGRDRVGFKGSTTLQRSDWGLDGNPSLAEGGSLIGDKVTLTLDISAVQVQQADTA